MESFKNRLKRFVDQDPLEIPGWLTVSMQNSILPEIEGAKQNRMFVLLFLGTHSIMQTVSEKLFGLRGLDGTRFYLETFVDGDEANTKFSDIADDLHEMRNVMAHQWWSSSTHDIAIDDQMPEGWKLEADLLHINPVVYADHFPAAFNGGSVIDVYRRMFSEDERLIRKYWLVSDWLKLKKQDLIFQEIQKLEEQKSAADLIAHEAVIKKAIYKAYNL